MSAKLKKMLLGWALMLVTLSGLHAWLNLRLDAMSFGPAKVRLDTSGFRVGFLPVT